MARVSFSGRCGHCRQALAPMVWGRAPCMTETNVPPGRCGSSDEPPGLRLSREVMRDRPFEVRGRLGAGKTRCKPVPFDRNVRL